jgi:hypothetical protein
MRNLEVQFYYTLDPSAPTIVSPKANLAKGDLFVISLDEEGTQKLVMQVDKVEDERQIQPTIPGLKKKLIILKYHI